MTYNNQNGEKKLWNDDPIILDCNVQRYKKIMTVAELMNFNESTGEISYKVDPNTGKATIIIGGETVIINPDHQRSYVWKDDVKIRFVESMIKGRDCNTISIAEYTSGNDELIKGKHCLNGQQRLRTIGDFLRGKITLPIRGYNFVHVDTFKKLNNGLYFRNFLKTEIVVQFLKGSYDEIMEEWKACNVPAEKHTNQEIRNGVYPGEWNNWMRSNFSQTGANGCTLVERCGCGSIDRQITMETCISWVAAGNERNHNKQDNLIDEFMKERVGKDDKNYCEDFWNKVYEISRWIKKWTLPLKDKTYKDVLAIGRKWGVLYNTYKDIEVPDNEIIRKFVDAEIVKIAKMKAGKLLSKEEKEKAKIEKMKDIIESLMISHSETPTQEKSRGEKFDDKVKNAVYVINKGICGHCGLHVDANEAHYHHLNPLSEGGEGSIKNCILLHPHCHNHATGDYDLFDAKNFPYAVNIID